jgi:uncharacterized Rossmann fold enzyme
MMNWTEWQPFYLDIVKRLNLKPSEDSRATMVLDSLLQDTQPDLLLDELKTIIENQIVVVCGAGPSLDKQLHEINSFDWMEKAVFVAADGATSALKESGYKCHIIVTDLDGNLKDILSEAKQGAIPIVHAHGDNIEKIKKVVPKFECIIGSTQVEPTGHVFLWGGFTDGDRACYIASHYNPKRILMVGMDFGNVVGRWSKPGHASDYFASERKSIKLKIAKELIMHLKTHCDVEINFLD